MPTETPCSACLSPTEPLGSAGGEAVACALEAAAAQFRGDAEEARWLTALLLRHVAMLLAQLGVLLRNRMQAAALAGGEMARAVAEAPGAETDAVASCPVRGERAAAPGAGGCGVGRPREAGAALSECVTDIRAEMLWAGGPAVSTAGGDQAGPDGLPVVGVGFLWLGCFPGWVVAEKRGVRFQVLHVLIVALSYKYR